MFGPTRELGRPLTRVGTGVTAAPRNRDPLLRWLCVSFGAVLLTAVAHELAHLLSYAALSLSDSSLQPPRRISFIVTAAGPGVTWGFLIGSSWIAWRWPEERREPLLAWVLGVAAGAGLRFVALGAIALAQIGWFGRVLLRNDEYRIARLTGIPIELLLIGGLVVALACWSFILYRVHDHLEMRQLAALLGGLILAVGGWLAIAYGFDIAMMK